MQPRETYLRSSNECAGDRPEAPVDASLPKFAGNLFRSPIALREIRQIEGGDWYEVWHFPTAELFRVRYLSGGGEDEGSVGRKSPRDIAPNPRGTTCYDNRFVGERERFR